MLADIGMLDQSRRNHPGMPKESVRRALQKLQALKSKVTDLRLQCEELRNQGLEEHNIMPLCSGCHNPLEPEQEIVVRDSNKIVRAYYHRECFKHLLQ